MAIGVTRPLISNVDVSYASQGGAALSALFILFLL
jgi:hypothetical protein